MSAGVGKVVISAGRDGTNRSTLGHAELYQDGSDFAAVQLWFLRAGEQLQFGVPVEDERHRRC